MIGHTGATGSNGPTGSTGAVGPGADFWDFLIGAAIGNLTVPPRVISTGAGLANVAVVVGPNGLFFGTANYPSTSFTQQPVVTQSLRAILPVTNQGPTAYATIGRYAGFIVPATANDIFGVCETGTNYVEFRYYDGAAEVVMGQSNVGSPVELAFSIQFYMTT